MLHDLLADANHVGQHRGKAACLAHRLGDSAACPDLAFHGLSALEKDAVAGRKPGDLQRL